MLQTVRFGDGTTQTGHKAHPATRIVGTVSFPAVKWPGLGANHTPASGTEIALPLPPLCVCIGMTQGDLYLDAQVAMSASISEQSTLQHTTVHYNTLQHIIAHYSTL